jgi:nucleoid-associated protein YgaU
MGIFDFVKNAGAKIFGKDRKDDDGDANNDGKLDAGRGLSGHLRDNGIDPRNLKFTFQGDTVVVDGYLPSQDSREKAVLIVGNVEGVARVDDRIIVGAPPAATASATPGAGTSGVLLGGASQSVAKHSAGGTTGWTSKTYTVEKGDTLSEIAQKMYGKANKYNVIFEANKPMLKDPDKIYPGQVLRIPPLEG